MHGFRTVISSKSIGSSNSATENKIKSKIYICIFREIKIEFSKALYTKICPYLEGFWSMKDCFGTGWYSLWWFLDPPLVTGLNARTGTWLLSGSFAYKKERYISVIFKKSLCQKLVKSYCNSISRNFLFYSRGNFKKKEVLNNIFSYFWNASTTNISLT